jgi:hypothetical protein
MERPNFSPPLCDLTAVLENYVKIIRVNKNRVHEEDIDFIYAKLIGKIIFEQMNGLTTSKMETASMLHKISTELITLKNKRLVLDASIQVGRCTDPDVMLRLGHFHPFFYAEFTFKMLNAITPLEGKKLFVPLWEHPNET